MGQYFMMSRHFDKKKAQDFGLIIDLKGEAINPIDNSKWIPTQLFDFGWGKENGYYKLPLMGFDKLYWIVMLGDNHEDIYGAAAQIMDLYPDELLNQCEVLLNKHLMKELNKLNDIFNLKLPFNHSTTLNKSYDQIINDFKRWEAVSRGLKDKTKR